MSHSLPVAKDNTLLRRLAVVLGTAMVLLFFSTFLFVAPQAVTDLLAARGDNMALLKGLVQLVLLHVLFAYGFMMVLSRGGGSVSELFLAACLYGWAIEGLASGALYADVPFSFAWPAMGWHAVIAVMLGWYLLRRLLYQRVLWKTAISFAAMGIFWGLWGTWFWHVVPVDGAAMPAPYPAYDFAWLVVVTTPLLAAGMALMDRKGARHFAESKVETGSVILLALLAVGSLGLDHVMGMTPLLPLLVPAAAALYVSARYKAAMPVQEFAGHEPPPLPHYGLAGLIPLLAIPVYSLLVKLDMPIDSDAVTGLLVILAALCFIGAVVICLSRPLIARFAKPDDGDQGSPKPDPARRKQAAATANAKRRPNPAAKPKAVTQA